MAIWLLHFPSASNWNKTVVAAHVPVCIFKHLAPSAFYFYERLDYYQAYLLHIAVQIMINHQLAIH